MRQRAQPADLRLGVQTCTTRRPGTTRWICPACSAQVTTPLNQHLHNQPWSPLAQELVEHRLQDKGTTLDAYAPVFNQAVASNA